MISTINSVFSGGLMNFLKKHADLITGAAIALFAFLIAFIFQGFAKYGLSAPFCYAGGDEFSGLVTSKLLKEQGWFWFNDRLGAPFGADSLDFPANLLLNFDLLVAKIISLFTSDAVVALNLRYLLIFPMCGISAYCVLRTLKINRVLSVFGSVMFSLTPFIFYRSTQHISLSACYFIPLSVLLCIWASESDPDDYLKFGKSFFKNRRNVLTLVFTLLIANNGIGYYPFFTCFFLCVIALCNLVRQRNRKALIIPAKIIVFTVGFMVVALIPALVYSIVNGVNSAAVSRGIEGAELYGLKIVQLFIPLDGKGIGFIQEKINQYNTYMPLVNENQSAYLGIFGIIGFLLSLLYLIKRDTGNDDSRLYFLSRMNVCAVLLATIGGFSSIVVFFFRMIRSYNRLSVFIMFISITFLCIVLQSAFESETLFKTAKIKKISVISSIAVMVLCVAELVPMYGSRDGFFETYSASYQSDKAFIQGIEDTLGENAMVFQLPYHATPEAGPVNGMADYQHYAGYINSDTLRWSYGATKGRKADIWNRYASSLPVNEMLEVICKAGFTGIYIDARAYTEEDLSELCDKLTSNIGSDRTVSENGCLMFYDLRGYIDTNGITADESVYLDYDCTVFIADQMDVSGNATREYNAVLLGNDSKLYGPYTELAAGTYTVTVYGSGLLSAEYTAMRNGGRDKLAITEISKTDTEITYTVTLDSKAYGVEFILFNYTDNQIVFNRVEIKVSDNT